MDEGDKKQVEGMCWKTILIAVVLIGIGVVIGRVTVGMCPLSKIGRCGSGGYGTKSCWKSGAGSKCCYGKKSWDKKCDWSKCKEKMSTCKAGCTCPKCSMKAACLSDPNKAGCPMKGKKAEMCKSGCTCPKCSQKAAEPEK